jgi:hypothetical protein
MNTILKFFKEFKKKMDKKMNKNISNIKVVTFLKTGGNFDVKDIKRLRKELGKTLYCITDYKEKISGVNLIPLENIKLLREDWYKIEVFNNVFDKIGADEFIFLEPNYNICNYELFEKFDMIIPKNNIIDIKKNVLIDSSFMYLTNKNKNNFNLYNNFIADPINTMDSFFNVEFYLYQYFKGTISWKDFYNKNNIVNSSIIKGF